MKKNTSISIVIASFSSVRHLERCLNSIKAGSQKIEIIVSTCFKAEDVRLLQQNFEADFVFNPDEHEHDSLRLRETRVFRLRSSGVKAAKGDLVFLLEDHCEVAETWLQAMLDVLQKWQCVAGGPIANNAESSLFRWALYWSEYAAMMPPFPDNNAQYLSAVNSAYHKAALDAC